MDFSLDSSTEVCQYLADWLPREIPISQSLALMPVEFRENQLTFSIPLEQNRNHMHTGFGGSLYTSALLVGWSWLHLKLKEMGFHENIHIVIQNANIQYPKPMTEDSLAICTGVSDQAWGKFSKMLHKFGKGRLTIDTKIVVNNDITTEFTGDFVVYFVK
ncbi:YiiD C-terminal domain-containing protein [Ignatzschineria sp. LJL83]